MSRFQNVNWVVTPVDPGNTRLGLLNAYSRLSDYLHGANERKAYLKRGAPAISTLGYNNKTGVITGIDLAIYLPYELNHTLPAPTNTNVFLEQWGEFAVYSRAFGELKFGDVPSPSLYVKKQLKHLDQALKNANITKYVRYDGLFLQAEYNIFGLYVFGRQRDEVMRIDDAEPITRTRIVDN